MARNGFAGLYRQANFEYQKDTAMHINSATSILYFGTPVVVISTKNEDGTNNLAPMSSIFWLGWRCIIGLGAAAQTTANLLRTRECVLNLPSVDQADQVNRLAKTTGAYPVPAAKLKKGYRYERDKFSVAGLHAVPSITVQPPAIRECPVQMECVVEAIHPLAASDPDQRGMIMSFELRIQRTCLDHSILLNGDPDRVDPDKWRPLIMSFQEFYGLGEKKGQSTLAQIPESLYNSWDQQRAMDMVPQ